MRGVTSQDLPTGLTCSFQLTRLMRGVTSRITEGTRIQQFQLTRLMRGVTRMTVGVKK